MVELYIQKHAGWSMLKASLGIKVFHQTGFWGLVTTYKTLFGV